MNFMNEAFVKEIEKTLGELTLSRISERRYYIDIDIPRLLSLLETLKMKGFSHLSIITGVDWIEAGEFEIAYTLFYWEVGITIIVKTRVSRETPILPTVMELWPTARFYERDVFEFFGVEFDGNPDLRPLILENWKELPPLRKDFDPEKFSKENFPDRQYDVDFLVEGSEGNE